MKTHQLYRLAFRLLTTTEDGGRADRIPSRNEIRREVGRLRRELGR